MIALENEFYRVEQSPIARNANATWRGKAQIFRKDTNEMIAHLSIRDGRSPQEVEHHLQVALQQKFAVLQKPVDWGKEPVIPALIRHYLAIRDKAYGFVVQAENAPAFTPSQALLQQGEALEAAALHGLKQRIAALSEEQKIALVMPTAQHREHLQSPRILEELGAKKFLYTLIDDPSPQLKASYHALEELLNGV